MHCYSYDDAGALDPDIDELTHERGMLDCFARDCDAFDDDICARSIDEYLSALFDDARDTPASTREPRETVSALAHVSAAIVARRDANQRELFDTYVTRYLSRFVNAPRTTPYVE